MSEEHVRLRDFIERVLEERQKALDLATSNLERRLSELNNLRADVTKDREMFLSKPLYEQMHAELMRRVSQTESRLSTLQGVGLTLVAFMGIIGFILGKMLK